MRNLNFIYCVLVTALCSSCIPVAYVTENGSDTIYETHTIFSRKDSVTVGLQLSPGEFARTKDSFINSVIVTIFAKNNLHTEVIIPISQMMIFLDERGKNLTVGKFENDAVDWIVDAGFKGNKEYRCSFSFSKQIRYTRKGHGVTIDFPYITIENQSYAISSERFILWSTSAKRKGK